MEPTFTHWGARVLAWLERESLPVTVFGLFVCGLIVRLPDQLRQDGWLALVSGRFVSECQHSWPSIMTLPFYVLAVACAWFLLRNRRSVTAFEQLALLLLFLSG